MVKRTNWCTLHATYHQDTPCENVRKYIPPTRFPGQGSYTGAATMARWSTTNREDPQDRADRPRSNDAASLRRYRDTYSSEDKPKRYDHPERWNRRHEAQQRRNNRRKGNPGTIHQTYGRSSAELAAKLGVEL